MGNEKRQDKTRQDGTEQDGTEQDRQDERALTCAILPLNILRQRLPGNAGTSVNYDSVGQAPRKYVVMA